jgi:23S rRNA (guanosine2251-2'-O)-methyltransferase
VSADFRRQRSAKRPKSETSKAGGGKGAKSEREFDGDVGGRLGSRRGGRRAGQDRPLGGREKGSFVGLKKGQMASSSSGKPSPPDSVASSREAVSGLNSTLAALTNRPEDCLELRLSTSRSSSPTLRKILDLAESLHIKPQLVSKAELDPFGSRHQGVVLFAKPQASPGFEAWLDSVAGSQPALALALDHLEDPRNLGALLRSAAAFGAKGLLAPKDRAASLTQAARAASAGGSEVVPLLTVVNISRSLAALKRQGFWVVAAEAETGQPLDEFRFPERSVLLLGAEGKGISRLAGLEADFRISVPLASSIVTSLNVSNAGAILMHAYFTQISSKSPRR